MITQVIGYDTEFDSNARKDISIAFASRNDETLYFDHNDIIRGRYKFSKVLRAYGVKIRVILVNKYSDADPRILLGSELFYHLLNTTREIVKPSNGWMCSFRVWFIDELPTEYRTQVDRDVWRQGILSWEDPIVKRWRLTKVKRKEKGFPTSLLVKLEDLQNYFPGSLGSMAKSFGIATMKDNDLITKNIANMYKLWEKNPGLVEAYNRSDALVTYKVFLALHNMFVQIGELNPMEYNYKFRTTAQFVSYLLKQDLLSLSSKMSEALARIAISKKTMKRSEWDRYEYSEKKDAFVSKKDQRRKVEMLLSGTELNSKEFYHTVGYMKHDPMYYLSIVLGGLTERFDPTKTMIGDRKTFSVFDVDKKKYYATILAEKAIVPVGNPDRWSSLNSEDEYSLGEFLEKYENDFVEGCWHLIVSGAMPKGQKLIKSNCFSPDLIAKYLKANDRVTNQKELKLIEDRMTSRMNTHYIENGVITSASLEVIRSFTNSNELHDWMELSVVAAVWYPKKYLCTDGSEFAERIVEENWLPPSLVRKGKYSNSVFTNVCPYWFKYPLSKFAKDFKRRREEVEASGNAGLGKVYKLCANIIFGISGSRFHAFPGNCTTGNYITDVGRSNLVIAGLLATNGVCGITDGFILPKEKGLKRIKDPDKRIPTLSTLAGFSKRKHSNITVFDVPNFGHDLEAYNSYIEEHLKEFCSNYGYEWVYKIGLKGVFKFGVVTGKSDYAFFDGYDKDDYKDGVPTKHTEMDVTKRGTKKRNVTSAYHTFYKQMYDNVPINIPDSFEQELILSGSMFAHMPYRNEAEGTKNFFGHQVRKEDIGFSFPTEKQTVFNLNYRSFPDDKTFRKYKDEKLLAADLNGKTPEQVSSIFEDMEVRNLNREH